MFPFDSKSRPVHKRYFIRQTCCTQRFTWCLVSKWVVKKCLQMIEKGKKTDIVAIITTIVVYQQFCYIHANFFKISWILFGYCTYKSMLLTFINVRLYPTTIFYWTLSTQSVSGLSEYNNAARSICKEASAKKTVVVVSVVRLTVPCWPCCMWKLDSLQRKQV